MSHYAAGFAVFDVKPPFQIRDAREWRKAWETSLAHFPAAFGTEMRDLVVTVSGELAVAHDFVQFTVPVITWGVSPHVHGCSSTQQRAG
jgi:ketosteroid isomerase-like protein